MLLSMGFAMVPLFQRVLNYFLVPVAITVRALVQVGFGIPPWRARYGAPGAGLWSLLAGPPCEPSTEGAAAVGSTHHDPRACPPLISLDGLGEAEQAVFGLSAWSGLGVIVAFMVAILFKPGFAEEQLGVEDHRLHEASTVEAVVERLWDSWYTHLSRERVWDSMRRSAALRDGSPRPPVFEDKKPGGLSLMRLLEGPMRALVQQLPSKDGLVSQVLYALALALAVLVSLAIAALALVFVELSFALLMLISTVPLAAIAVGLLGNVGHDNVWEYHAWVQVLRSAAWRA